ncbi:siderophore-interacting protein, partial [Cronobacter sakazakii]
MSFVGNHYHLCQFRYIKFTVYFCRLVFN